MEPDWLTDSLVDVQITQKAFVQDELELERLIKTGAYLSPTAARLPSFRTSSLTYDLWRASDHGVERNYDQAYCSVIRDDQFMQGQLRTALRLFSI